MLKISKKAREAEKEIMAGQEERVSKMTVKEAIEGKFRENVIDIVMILPREEGTIQKGGLVTMRVDLNTITNIEFMSGVFRQMWMTLVTGDKQVKKIYDKFFLEQKKLEIKMENEMKRLEKIANKRAVQKKK